MRRALTTTQPIPLGRNRGRGRLSPAMELLGSALPLETSLIRITRSTLPDLWPNWLKQLPGLTIGNAQDIIRSAVDILVRERKQPEQLLEIRRQVQALYPQIAPLTITKLLSLLTGISDKKSKYPADYEFLKTGSTGVRNLAAQATESFKSDAAYFYQEASDKAKRGTAAIVDTAVKAEKELEKKLPFYLRPGIIVPMLIGIVGLSYWREIRSFFPSSNSVHYRRNPEGGARQRYKEFMGRSPKKSHTIPAIDTSELALLGTARELGYSSTKWGQRGNYLHDFGKGVKFYSTPDGKAIVITGGKMKIKPEGIVD